MVQYSRDHQRESVVVNCILDSSGTCTICGWQYRGSSPIAEVRRNCGVKSKPKPKPEVMAIETTEPEPLPEGMPPILQRARSFVVAIGNFVSDGCKMVSREEYIERLATCAGCEFVKGNWCSKCGCWLSFKSRGRAFDCPKGKWPRVGDKSECL